MNGAKDGYGWSGTRVRHTDGRTGLISRESPDFMGVDLRITVDGGGEERVRLNARHGDGGAMGWSWYCENFSGGAVWIRLGDHNPDIVERDVPAVAAPGRSSSSSARAARPR